MYPAELNCSSSRGQIPSEKGRLMADSAYTGSADTGARAVRSDVGLFLAAFAVCLLFRLPALGDLAFWYDEVMTADAIAKSWSGMAWERLSQGHLPTYFAVLKGFGLSGGSEFMLRLPSALLDGAAGGLVAVMANRIGGTVSAIAAASLYATLPILIIYGQEARPYALQLLCVALAMQGQIGLLRREGSAPGNARLATLGALGSILAIPAGAVIVAMQHLAVLACGGVRKGAPERRIWLRHMATTWLIAALALMSLYPSVLFQAGRPEGLMKWQAATSLSVRIKGVLQGTYGFRVPEDLDRYWPPSFNAALMWSLFALMAIGLIANRRSLVHRYLAIVAIGTFVAFMGVAAFTAVTGRYLIGMMPAAVMLAAFGVGALLANGRARWFALPWLALFGAGLVLQGLDTLAAPRKYDWRPVARFLHDAGFRQGVVHTDVDVFRRELGHYVDKADTVAFRAISPGESIDALWRKASDQPVAWFVVSAWRGSPPMPTSEAVVCTWPFGKMKVMMVARDRAGAPDGVRNDLADPRICTAPAA
ncbi:hypothetical protein [Kaistia nematophila]|nr:hypothetical protein [Kaistia nematophila]